MYEGRVGSVDGPLGKKVVLDLSKQLEGKKHHVYLEPQPSSVSLLTTLCDRGLYACGTARQNYRNFPEALRMKGKGKLEMERHGLSNRYSTCRRRMFGYLSE